MKVKFICEKGMVSDNYTIDLSKIRINNPVKVLHNFHPDRLITEGVVTREDGVLMCEADIPDQYIDTYPAVGVMVDSLDRSTCSLMSVSVCDQRNEDESIKTILHQLS